MGVLKGGVDANAGFVAEFAGKVLNFGGDFVI